jgi:hypothetical protein
VPRIAASSASDRNIDCGTPMPLTAFRCVLFGFRK